MREGVRGIRVIDIGVRRGKSINEGKIARLYLLIIVLE